SGSRSTAYPSFSTNSISSSKQPWMSPMMSKGPCSCLRLVGEQLAEELPLAAAEVQHAAGAARLDRGEHCADALAVQRQRPLDCLLLGVVLGRRGVRVGLILLGEARQGVAREARLVLEVAAGDEVLLRVPRQPVRAAGEELGDFILSDPVVLVVVE